MTQTPTRPAPGARLRGNCSGLAFIAVVIIAAQALHLSNAAASLVTSIGS
ncbi:hypothetical protein AB3M83_09330 [Microbacterium sp. 179-B 1A2 NHS]